jgi:hypothetical protein
MCTMMRRLAFAPAATVPWPLMPAQAAVAADAEGDGYGGGPREDVIASIEGGKFVFKGYLRDSLDHLGITDAAIRGEFKKFKIILQ